MNLVATQKALEEVVKWRMTSGLLMIYLGPTTWRTSELTNTTALVKTAVLEHVHRVEAWISLRNHEV